MRLIAAFLMLALSAFGEDLYVSHLGAGSQDGSSCANAHSVVWFNTVGNWGVGADKISAGDTVHLCGTIATNITVQGSGSAGSPVTLLFEAGAQFVMATLPANSKVIDLNTQNYITVNGAGGMIWLTNNGTGLVNSNQVTGVYADGSFINVQNLIVTNIYLFNKAAVPEDSGRKGTSIKVSCNNSTVSNNVCSGADTLINAVFGAGYQSNLVISANVLTRANHAIQVSCGQTKNSFLGEVLIDRNSISNLDFYGGSATYHLDGMIFVNESSDFSSWVSNMTIRANIVGPGIGTVNTAGVFIDYYRPQELVNGYVYNNLFITTGTDFWNNGAIAYSAGTNGLVANNTFILPVGTGMLEGSSFTDNYNNLYYGPTRAFSESAAGVYIRQSDYNVLYKLSYNINGSIFFSWEQLPYSSLTGTLPANSYVTGQVSGAIGTVWRTVSSHLDLRNVVGTFNGTETVAGASGSIVMNGSKSPQNGSYIFGSNSTYNASNPASPNNGWWQNIGYDMHSKTNQPSLDANYVPTSGDTVARGAGTNLSAYFTTDFYGNARPAVGNWTIGAFESATTLASFTGSPTGGLAPLTVTFTDSSSLATNWAWTFSNGGTSTATNPVMTFTNSGTYNVSLTVIGPTGTNTLTRTGYIVATNLPVIASFTGTPTVGIAPLAVTFTNLSTGASNYTWAFGDTKTSTATNPPANTYTNPGIYTVSLTAVGLDGTNMLQRVNYITATNVAGLVGPAAQILGNVSIQGNVSFR